MRNEPALHIPARARDENGVRAGIDIDAVDVDSETALMLAIYKGFVPAIHILLEAGADIEASESKYFTALILAVILADVLVVSILLQAGANIERLAIHGEQTPVIWAAYRGNNSVIRILLEAGADVGWVDYFGRAALSSATSRGDTSIILILLAAGSNFHSL
jgi:ankyrin repeat protein